jgi:cytochrome c553
MGFLRFAFGCFLILLSAHGFAGDPERGATLVGTCAACHGVDGIAPIAEYPHLAGQSQRYIAAQLELIQTGVRPVPLMAGLLNGMTPQDFRDIGAYYAAMPPAIGQADPDEDLLDTGERIYRAGIREKNVAACAACHSPTGAGNPPAGFPRVGGLSTEYLVAQLRAYRERERVTDEEYGAVMRDVAHGLTDTEMRAVSNYMLGLH